MADSVSDAGSESAVEAQSDSPSVATWSILAVGGAASLCCLFAAPVAAGAAGGVVGGGAVATLGGSLLQIAVAALAVGVVGLAITIRDRYGAGTD